MTKKKSTLIISDNLTGIFAGDISARPTPNSTVQAELSTRLTIEKALATITRQMEISGNRPRTISDYRLHVDHFAKMTGHTYVDELTADSIYRWLASMSVSPQTKLIRLKCLKAFLSRCFDNGWVPCKFWTTIHIKVDSNVKEGATERDIRVLMSVLNLGDFVQLRDATAAYLMYKTGIRIQTLVHLETKHVDLDAKLLRLDGAIMKNHKQLLLPFDDTLHRLLSVLMNHNDVIRREHGQSNQFVFVTMHGGIIANSPTHNNIQKRLNKYAKEFGLKNINPHALRRGFAKSLLDKGARITDISKALGHSDLAVTTKYLHLEKEEVAENLRRFL